MKLSIATAIAFATLVATGLTIGSQTSQAAQLKSAKTIKTVVFNKTAIARTIRREASARGVKLSSRQVNAAVNQAVGGFKSNGPGVQKIKIHIKTKRFEICVATGQHRGQCG